MQPEARLVQPINAELTRRERRGEFNIVIIVVISVFVNMEERQVEPINVQLSPLASAS